MAARSTWSIAAPWPPLAKGEPGLPASGGPDVTYPLYRNGDVGDNVTMQSMLDGTLEGVVEPVTTLRMGSASADITPGWSLTLAGFAARTGPSQGVSQPIRVRVSVLESRDDMGEANRAVVAVADMLWWGPQQVPALRAEIAAVTGAPEANILLSATHTHSGPQTTTRASATIGVVDPRFLDLLRERTLDAARAAAARLEPVTVSRLDGTHGLGFNRRYALNPHGPEDQALVVLRFDRANGEPATLWVHYTCHPVITQEPLISGEFCGVAMDLLESRHGVTALYLQGCCGDINPRVGNEQRTVRGTNGDVERIGEEFAGAVTGLLANGEARRLRPVPLAATHLDVDLPYATLPTVAELQAQANEPDVYGELARAMLDHPDWLAPSIPLHLQRLDVADGLSLLAMNGEIVVEYGLRIREAGGGATLPMGYANGMTGYVPTARIIAEGGYEAGEARPYFFLPAPFDPTVETVMNDAIDRITR